MSSNPLISVVMPVYNEEDHLEQAIESIVNQTLENIEIIIVDDGSSDATPDIIEQYDRRDDRVRTFRFEEPYGDIRRAHTYGNKQARAKWVAIQAGDDWSDETRLEKQWNFLHEQPEADIVTCQTYDVFPDGSIKESPQFNWVEPDTLAEKMYQICPFSQGTMVMRKRDFFELGGYRNQNYSNHDCDLQLRAFVDGLQYRKLEEGLLYHRRRPGSYSPEKLRGIASKYEFLLPRHYSGERPLAIWGTGKAADYLYKSMEPSPAEYEFDFFIQSKLDTRAESAELIEQSNLDVLSPTDAVKQNPFIVAGTFVSFNDMYEEIESYDLNEYEDFVFFM